MKKIRESVVFKSAIVIIVPLFILSVVTALIGYRGFTDGMMELYENGAVQIANTAVKMVDPDLLDNYAEPGADQTMAYKVVHTELDSLCNSSGATFIYVIRPDLTDYGHITFLFSTINRQSTYDLYPFLYYRETTNDEYRTKYRALYEGSAQAQIVVRDRGYIETDAHITAMVPLVGSDGQTKGILCVQRQMEDMTNVRNRFVLLVMLSMVALVVLMVIGQHFYLRRVLLRPLKTITDEAVRFAEKEEPAEQKLTEKVKTRDEIGRLAGSIDHMEEQLILYTEELTAATAEKERINTEMSLAKRIQADMLPNVFPPFPDRKVFDIYATMKPDMEVGVDFYDFFFVDEDHLALVIADVSGKGVPAALFMMATKIMLQNIALSGAGPKEILETANNRICQNNQEEMFVTVWLGILDLKTGKMTAANAGHEYPVISRTDGTFELLKDKHGFVIGGMEGVRYREYEMTLEPEQGLFVYTDGVPEATANNNEMYGTDRMLAVLNRAPGQDPQQMLEAVKADVDRFVGDAPQFDDLTMLCIRYKGAK